MSEDKTQMIKFTKLIPAMLLKHYGNIGMNFFVKNKILKAFATQNGKRYSISVQKRIKHNKEYSYLIRHTNMIDNAPITMEFKTIKGCVKGITETLNKSGLLTHDELNIKDIIE